MIQGSETAKVAAKEDQASSQTVEQPAKLNSAVQPDPFTHPRPGPGGSLRSILRRLYAAEAERNVLRAEVTRLKSDRLNVTITGQSPNSDNEQS